MSWRNYWMVAILLLSPVFILCAQDRTEGYFVESTMLVGDTVRFVVVSDHDPRTVYQFPDSSTDYTPFELVDITAFPSSTSQQVTRDCTVYLLQSFELDSMQSIRLTVTSFPNSNPTPHVVEDAIVFTPLIQELPDTMKLAATLSEASLVVPTNTDRIRFYWVVASIVLVLLLLVSAKPLNRFLKKRRITSKKQQLQLKLAAYQASTGTAKETEELNTAVRQFLSSITGYDLRSMTSREAANQLGNAQLGQVLQQIDQQIYRPTTDKLDPTVLQKLEDVSTTYYKQAIHAI